MATKGERVFKAFAEENELPVYQDVPFRPKAGFQYFFEWNSADDKENWRADGYRWKQNGKVTYSFNDVDFIKIYFKILVGPDKYSTAFTKTAYINTSVPKRVFVWYEGDDTVAVDLPHGNAKHSSKRNSVYLRTKPSILAQLKASSEKRPSQVYNDILATAAAEVTHQGVNVPRDLKQVQNARRRKRTGDVTRPSSTTNTEGCESEADFDERGDAHSDAVTYCETSELETTEVEGNYIVIESSQLDASVAQQVECHLQEAEVWEANQRVNDAARKIVDQNQITLVPSRRVWLVESASRWPFMVSLFEHAQFQPRCTCKERKICCHIAAAMMSIGYHASPRKSLPNNGTARGQAKRKRSDATLNGQSDEAVEGRPSTPKRTGSSAEEIPWGLLG